MKTKSVVSLLVGISIGAIGGWTLQYQQKEKDLRTLVVVHHLERVSFAVNTLSRLPENSEIAEDLQLLILRSSLTELDHLSSAGKIEAPIPLPSLTEGLRRAENYAASHGYPDLAEKASVVSQRLSNGA